MNIKKKRKEMLKLREISKEKPKFHTWIDINQ